MTARRSRPRAYLLLARVSNLPTVWTNVLAGLVVARADLGLVVPLAAAVSLFYTGGMFLNDAFDAGFDARTRPDRPIPAGDVTRQEAFLVGFVLLAAGECLLLIVPHRMPALLSGVFLSAAIVFYNYRHKDQWFGPVVMGLCRALVYVLAAAGAAGVVSIPVMLAATAMWAYVIALTWAAKGAGAQGGALVPWFLAGISLVDAAVVALAGEPVLALTAVGAFALTLALQRVVSGT